MKLRIPLAMNGIAANRSVLPELLSRVRQALLDFDPLGSHAAGPCHGDKTGMPRGFTAAHDSDYAGLREWAARPGYFSQTKSGAVQ